MKKIFKKTHADMIKEAMEELGIAKSNSIIDFISTKYPELIINKNSFQADIIGCSINHSSSRHHPGLPKFLLHDKEKGTYQLCNPDKIVDETDYPIKTSIHPSFKFEETRKIVSNRFFANNNQSIKIEKDIEKGSKLAELLYTSFSTSGILGQTEMPEDIIPKGIEKGTLEHILFITLSVSLDYQRDAPALWASSRKTLEDPATRYLFDPKSLHENSLDKVLKDMQKYKLSKKPQKDAEIWRTVGDSFYSKWAGDPRKFLQDCNWDSTIILDRLKKDGHLNNNKQVPDYPYLRGSKIGPLWLRMLRDNAGISNLVKLEKVPIPVDIHVARATLATGIIKGKGVIGFKELFEQIREAWSESVKYLKIKNRPMIALDIDEPLWHLSKYGCTNRDKITGNCPVQNRCEARDFCVNGKIKIENSSGFVELGT